LRPNFQEHEPTIGEVAALALAAVNDPRIKIGMDRLLRCAWGAEKRESCRTG
jgi:hypothetical protein